MRVFAPSDHQLATAVDNPVAGRPLAAHHETVRPKVTRWEAVGVGLTGIGVLLLLFLVYLYAFTPLTGVRDQHRLLQSLTGHPRSVFSLTNGRLPAPGQPVALLELPVLHERQVVVNGTAPADLQEGPGLMTGTAVPGEPGDAVIAGRRVTYGAPFGRLSSLAPADAVKVVDGAGTFTFRVVGSKVVPLGGRDRVPHSGDTWLTLVTSNSSVRPSGEFVVTARLVGRPAVGVRSSEVGAPSVRLALAGDPAAGRWALVWAIAFLVVLAATLVAVRRWRQPAVTYLLAAPILLACGLFVCENLAQCLPATL
jgi:sortase A